MINQSKPEDSDPNKKRQLAVLGRLAMLKGTAYTMLTCAKTCSCVFNWLATRTEAKVAAVSDMLPVRVSVS